MTHPQQFMIYHLYEWDAARQKYKKKPVGLDGSPLVTGGGIPTHPDRAAVQAVCTQLGPLYRVGLWLSQGCGMFFLDLDEDAVTGGALTPSATEFAHELVAAGCYFEASTSGKGAHVIGRYSGELPPHSIQRPLAEPAPHALYTEGRGCVLAAPGEATTGSWDVDATPALLRLLAAKFPPRATGPTVPLGVGPRKEWRGPVDDDMLIARMLGAGGSAAARLGGKLTLSQLWNGQCSYDNESDMALAAHLAFWTGCDAERMERLMRRSPLARHRLDKWDSHRTYLQELTITKACTTTLTVYVEPQRVDTLTALLGARVPTMPVVELPPELPALPALPDAEDWHTLTDKVITSINNAGNAKELIDAIMPTLPGYGWPSIHGERVVNTLNKRLDLFGAKQPLAVLRRLVMPPVDASTLTPTVPEWAQALVFVKRTDSFYELTTGSTYSAEGVRMQFARFMPIKQSTGAREDPIQWLRDRWEVVTVDDVEYRPDQPSLFEHGGRTFANEFRASTMPTPVVGSGECSACIQLFCEHLAAVVNQRAPIYAALLGWLAHNVQRPGVKIRWAPLVKGVGGDGKSIIGELLFAAMGEANVKITSTSTISNSGGFTDWAIGGCVNVIEEIRLEGKERRKLYNSMKTIIGDSRVNPNQKGKASVKTHTNITNHIAFTNYEDATPIENGDRRWGVVFTPWPDAEVAARVKGLMSADELPSYFGRLVDSMKAEPGAWRAWLMGIDLSSFDPNGRAPATDEREAMVSSGEDFTEQTIRDCIDRGCSGVTVDVFDSASLMNAVQREMGERPDSRSWNRFLTDIGYRQVKPLWWNSKTRRVWVKYPMEKDKIIEKLTASSFPALPT